MPRAQREGKLLLAASTVGSGRESFMALASYFWDDYGKGGVILWHRASSPFSLQCCLALAEPQHSPMGWAVPLDMAVRELVPASWPKLVVTASV